MDDHRKLARGRTPVTWHPLFPAILAVWFGALFGLGVLAVRTALLEAAALSFGIDRLIPAAAPPLGTTARILLAFAFALTGGAIGAAIGLLMARSRPDNVARRAEAAAAREATQAERAIAEMPTAQTVERGETPGFFDISRLNLDDELRIDPVLEIDAEPEVEILAADERGAPTELKQARAFERPLDPVSFPLPESFPVPGGAAAARLTAASLDSLSHLELIERLALSLQKRREEAAAAPNEDAPAAIETEAVVESPAPVTANSAPSYYPTVSEAAAERGYASLLGLSRQPLEAGDHVENSAIARFRDLGPARPTSEATERALRDALATLQRMSGAA